MWVNGKDYYNLLKDNLIYEKQTKDLKKEVLMLKDKACKLEQALLRYEKGECDIYCIGCKHMIVSEYGRPHEKRVCSLNRKCKNYENVETTKKRWSDETDHN